MIDVDGITFMPGFQLALTTEGGGFGSLEIYHRTVNTRTRAQEPYTAIHTAAIPEEAWDDEKVMLSFIRDHVMHVVTHEVDEWLRSDDELIHDPNE
jgi:hypothetical protein